jgi:hypothetical protein
MPRLGPLDVPKEYTADAVEATCRELWERESIHRFDPDAKGECPGAT